MGRVPGGAEVLEECLQRRRGIQGGHHAIVVAGDGEDRRRVIAVGLVELVVLILGLSKAVDHVAEVIKERRHLFRVGIGVVRSHLVGHLRL